jgi:hypothetical protein
MERNRFSSEEGDTNPVRRDEAKNSVNQERTKHPELRTKRQREREEVAQAWPVARARITLVIIDRWINPTQISLRKTWVKCNPFRAD